MTAVSIAPPHPQFEGKNLFVAATAPRAAPVRTKKFLSDSGVGPKRGFIRQIFVSSCKVRLFQECRYNDFLPIEFQL